jgi:hypothetical protein
MGTSHEIGGGMNRWLSLSGLASVVVVLAAFSGLGNDTPGEKASAADVMAFYDAHQGRQAAAAFVLAVAAPLIVLFGVNLAMAFWPTQTGRRPVWQSVLIGGSVFAGMAFALTALFHFAVAQTADNKSLSAGAAQAFNVLDNHSWMVFNAGLGVFMLGAAGTLIPHTGAFRKLGWVALVAGVAFYIPFADFLALVVTGLWLITTSVLLFRSQRQPRFAGSPKLA